MPGRRIRSGFSLADLLTTIAIVGILIAGWLPAVEQDREGARRAQCMNKLKQLGVGLDNHYHAHVKLPGTSYQGNDGGAASVWWPTPGSAAATGAIPSVGYTTDAGTTKATAGYSWIVRILPYIDEPAVYNAISQASGKFAADAFTPYDVEGKRDGVGTGAAFSVSFTAAKVTTTRHFCTIQFDEVLCPSYGGTPTVATSLYSGKPAGNPPEAYGGQSGSKNLGSPAQYATITNYVALSATHFPCMQYGRNEKLAATSIIPADAEAPNGVIVPGTGMHHQSTTDGFTNTLIVCETIEPAMNCWYDGTTAWTTGINPNSVADHPPSKTDPTAWGAKNRERFWLAPAGSSTALNVGPAPFRTTTAYSPALAGYCATPQVISWGPSSNHAGGVVNHLALDGAVHAIASDIDPTVYMHLITRAGREPDAIP